MSSPDTLIPVPMTAPARARGRFGVAFGRRFFIVLLVGLIWVAPAFVQPRFLYAILAWDILALIVWAIDLWQLPKPEHLFVTRVWRSPAALSVRAMVGLRIVNRKNASVHVEAIDDLPPELRREPATVKIGVASRGEAEGEYDILPIARGETTTGNVYLRYQSPFRMAERWAVVPLKQTIRTYPNLEEAKQHSVFLIRSRQIEMEKRFARIRGTGREFESLREYRAGDEFRDICWSATARRGKLVTRIYQMERSQSVWIVLDSGRLMRTQVAGLTKLDYAVNAALSLAQVALYSGDRVGVMSYGRTIKGRVPAARGSAHLRQIMEDLAEVQTEGSEADHLRAAGVLLSAQKRRSLVVWLTDLAETAMTPEVIEAASQLMPQHLVLFVVIGQPDMSILAASEPSRISEMYTNAAAHEVIHRRELLLAKIRERGALAYEAASGTLSASVINSYLDVKQRGQL